MSGTYVEHKWESVQDEVEGLPEHSPEWINYRPTLYFLARSLVPEQKPTFYFIRKSNECFNRKHDPSTTNYQHRTWRFVPTTVEILHDSRASQFFLIDEKTWRGWLWNLNGSIRYELPFIYSPVTSRVLKGLFRVLNIRLIINYGGN